MIALRDVQAEIAAFMRRGARPSAGWFRHPHLEAEAVLAVHRRNFAVGLREALAAAYPTLVRLVGPGFFAFAADRFVTERPPASPCLSEYGRHFADFLTAFSPSAHLAYLPDVARLEWALHESALAPAAAALDAVALAAIPPAALPGRRFGLDPTLRFVRAAWPADEIVAAARAGEDGPPIAITRAAIYIQVRRHGRAVRSLRLAAGAFALRAALAGGETLEHAWERAHAADPGLDLAAALSAVVADGVLAAVIED